MGVLVLVRHGQASFGAEDYDVLSEVGRAQSRRLGEVLAQTGLDPAAVLHGQMRRQRDTATEMVDTSGWNAPAQTDARWDEFGHLGVIAAYSSQQVTDRRGFQGLFEQATARWASAEHDEDYDETYAAFVGRVRDGLTDATRLCGSGSSAVVVTSGGAIAAVGALLLGAEVESAGFAATWQRLNAVLVNTSVTRVLVGSSGPRLLTFNEHSHLDRELLTYR